MGDISKHFSWWEFESGDGAEMPGAVKRAIRDELVPALEAIRELVGKPLGINSGYRSPEHNASLKPKPGSTRSQHLKGKAADIDCPPGVTSDNLALMIGNLIALGYIPEGGIGLYHGRVHYDVRGKRARWDVRS